MINRRFVLKHIFFFGTMAGAAFFGIFFILNRVLPDLLTFHSLKIAIDDKIPFIYEWELIYFFTVILPFLPTLVIKDRKYFLQCVKFFILSLAICYVFYLILPVAIDRPVPTDKNFLAWGVLVNHAVDNPINCFPSFHVGAAFVTAFMMQRIHLRIAVALHILAILISLSVLFVKAHFFLDVIGGFLLALSTYLFYFKKQKPIRHKRPVLRYSGFIWLFVIYLIVLLLIFLLYKSGWVSFEMVRAK